MKTILGILFVVAMLFSVPSAQAQRGGHSSGHSSGHSNGGQRGGSQHTGGSRGSTVKGHSNGHSSGHSSGHSRGNYDVNRGRLREDHERNFGHDHLYRGGNFHWYGPEYIVGSRFFIGGFWFEVGSPWFVIGNPYAFDYYVVWDEDADGYFVYSDAFPGSRVAVSVVF